jgi:hypothetical protein
MGRKPANDRDSKIIMM